jgi:HAD superfamily hydrolase (TIGR01509 family)
MKPKAVLFDIEGTLIDTEDIYLEVINEICHRMGFNEMGRETVRELIREQKAPWDYVVPQGVVEREELIEQCRKLDEELFPKIFIREAQPFPGVLETLKSLVNEGVKVGLVTSGWDFGLGSFDWGQELLGLVSVVITRDDVPMLKPAPDPIVECLRRLGVSASEAVYVGDSPVDVRAGRAAGTMTIGVLSGASDYDILNQEQPDMILQEVRDLPSVISI